MSEQTPEDPKKKTGTDTDQLSEEELASLAGALPIGSIGVGGGGYKPTLPIDGGSDSCKATGDTGIGGCPG